MTATIIINSNTRTTTTTTSMRRMQTKSSSSSTGIRLFAIMLIIAIFSFSANTSSTTSNNNNNISLFVSAIKAAGMCTEDVSTNQILKKNGVNMCVWAAKKGNKRTDKLCGKKKKNINRKKIRIMHACPCTCHRVIEQDKEQEQDNEDTDFNGGQTDPDGPPDVVLPAIEVCPKKYDESSATLTPTLCFPEYKDKLTCDYEYTYQGCTWETLECVPIRSCTCNAFGDNKWACTEESRAACIVDRPERPPRGESDARSLLRTLHNHHDNHHDTGEEKHTRRARRRDLTEDISAPKLNGMSCDPLDLDNVYPSASPTKSP